MNNDSLANIESLLAEILDALHDIRYDTEYMSTKLSNNTSRPHAHNQHSLAATRDPSVSKKK